MSATWQTKTRCRKCAAPVLVRLEAGESDGTGLTVFYCPACGERAHLEIPAGYDARSTTVRPDEG